jgi:uncharacterized protein (DUF2147 family)
MEMVRTSFWTCAAALAAFLGPAAAQGAATGPNGFYMVEDGGSQIEFYQCGEATCGRIAWMLKGEDKKGRPLVDKKNPNPSLRTTPLLGLTILYGLRPGEDPNAYEGEVYNPQDGNTYPVTVTVTSDSEIQVRGCGLAGLICQTQAWARAAPLTMEQPSQ